MRLLRSALLGLVVLGSAAASATVASAMPIAPLAAPAANVETVRWVCGPYRCFWRPNFYGGYGYYGPPRVFYGGPRFYGRPYGWGGGWRGGGWRRW